MLILDAVVSDVDLVNHGLVGFLFVQQTLDFELANWTIENKKSIVVIVEEVTVDKEEQYKHIS